MSIRIRRGAVSKSEILTQRHWCGGGYGSEGECVELLVDNEAVAHGGCVEP